MDSFAVDKFQDIKLTATTKSSNELLNSSQYNKVVVMNDNRLFIGIDTRIFVTPFITEDRMKESDVGGKRWECCALGLPNSNPITHIAFVRGGSQFFVVQSSFYSLYRTTEFLTAALSKGWRVLLKPQGTNSFDVKGVSIVKLITNPVFSNTFAVLTNQNCLFGGRVNTFRGRCSFTYVPIPLCLKMGVNAVEFTGDGRVLVGLSDACVHLLDWHFRPRQIFTLPDCVNMSVDRIDKLNDRNFIVQLSSKELDAVTGLPSLQKIKAFKLNRGSSFNCEDIDGLRNPLTDSYLICNIPEMGGISLFSFKNWDPIIFKPDWELEKVGLMLYFYEGPVRDSPLISISCFYPSPSLAFVLIMDGNCVIHCSQLQTKGYIGKIAMTGEGDGLDVGRVKRSSVARKSKVNAREPRGRWRVPAQKEPQDGTDKMKEVNKRLKEENQRLIRDNQRLKDKIQLQRENKELAEANLKLKEENERLKEEVS